MQGHFFYRTDFTHDFIVLHKLVLFEFAFTYIFYMKFLYTYMNLHLNIEK
jgi:hypothetical protein